MKAKILLIEDSPSQAHEIVGMLEKSGYEALWADGGIKGLKMARMEGPDLILLDVLMEDMDGHSVCRWLKVHESTRDIPVIMLTVKKEVEDKVLGLNVGADDYLAKPFDQKELEARIFASLRAKLVQEELKKRNTELEQLLSRVELMAITDSLTGLFNRRRFYDVLQREFATTRRYNNQLSIIMLDIDHFKKINDGYGHPAGDQVLKEIATILITNLREVDLASRYGGEEFAVLLPHTAKENALSAAERIQSKIRLSKIPFDGNELCFTVSMGIASVMDVERHDPDELISHADTALYEAKHLGRDQIVLYDAKKNPKLDT